MNNIPINEKLDRTQIEEFTNKFSNKFLFNENLVVDGIPITLSSCKIKDMRYGINVYIAGELRGLWVDEKYEDVVSKVWCKRTARPFKKSDYKALRVVYGKKKADEKMKPIPYYSWVFTSVKRLELVLRKAKDVKYFGTEDDLINPIIESFKEKHPEMFKATEKFEEAVA